MSALTTPHCVFRHLQVFVYKHLQAFVYRHLQLGKGISIYVTLKVDADTFRKKLILRFENGRCYILEKKSENGRCYF